MRIGTAEPDSTFYHQGAALRQVLLERGAAGPVEVLTAQAASTENAVRLHEGGLDFGFMASNWVGRAVRGETPFATPIDLRMVAPANKGPLFFIVRAESGVTDVRGLKGKRVCVGARTSGMTQHAHTIFGKLGIGFDDFEPVYMHFAEGARALEAGEVDAQLQCPIPNPVMTGLDQRVDLRVLPYAAGDLERVLAEVPYYRPARMRAGDLRALRQDVDQPAVVNVVVAHARADAALVRQVAGTMCEGAGRLAGLEPLYRGLGELFEPLRSEGAAALEFGGARLHEGALEAYRAAGLLR